MTNKIDLKNFVESAYKRYSLYTLQYRAIPHLIDGLKSSQRKIIFTSLKRAKSMILVSVLGGYVKAESVYHHGNVSLEEAISMMARDYTGSNNLPLFTGEGNFGSIFDSTISSARYVFVKNSPIMEKIFLKEDENILLQNVDIENPEPLFYLPILPWVLVNGVKGMAVGYATNILSYNIKDIIYNLNCLMKNEPKKCREMIPFYKGYKGLIEKVDNKWIMFGKIDIINSNKIIVREIPIGHCRESYENYLYGLIDKDVIKEFRNLSSEDEWKIEIKVDSTFTKQTNQKILEDLGLKEYLNENINVLYDDKIIHYNNALELLKEYYFIRISFYEKRKTWKLNKYVEDILKLMIKLKINLFIKDKKQDNLLKEDILKYVYNLNGDFCNAFKSLKISYLSDSDSLEKLQTFTPEILSSLRLLDVTDEKIEEMKIKIKEIANEFKELESTKEIELYQSDLLQFLKSL